MCKSLPRTPDTLLAGDVFKKKEKKKEKRKKFGE